MMFELFLSKTPNREASPAVARKPRHPAKKFSSHFLICARRFFSSKRKRKLLCGALLSTSRTAGLSAFCIRSGVAEFPPHPPSAMPSLSTPTEFVFCLAKCAAKDSFTKLLKLSIIIVSRKNPLYYILYTIMLYKRARYVKQ